jgi:predicted RecB family nuclease
MFLLRERADDEPVEGAPVVTSASDLTLASQCEFAFLRTLDAKLGRVAPLDVERAAMEARAARLGDVHEERVLAASIERLGRDGVVEIERPSTLSRESLRDAAAQTRAALESGAPMVFQATFFDEREPASPFVGFADFIVRLPDDDGPEPSVEPGGAPRYRVQDTKLARSAKVTALMQLAAYAEQLETIDVSVDETVELILGDGSISRHRLDDIRPVFENRRARLRAIVAEHLAESGPVAWGDPRYTVDGRCEHCELEVEAHRDLLLVAGMRTTQRDRLRAVGITTIDELAATRVRPADCGLADGTYRTLQSQAALQVRAPRAPLDETDAGADATPGTPTAAPPTAAPPFVVHTPATIGTMPPPDAGDVFFDFEGDPLYTEGVPRDDERASWGLDYLFGLVDRDERFTAFWAHDFAQEREALIAFLDWIVARRRAHPGMHIYHYAAYERTHLLSLAARHGVGERIVDDLLRDNVLVDLYPIVRRTVRVGTRSYSIKKLEPLYMGDETRDDMAVTAGADSIGVYVHARELRDAGRDDEADAVLAEIGDYNRYDCVSTLRLRDWLLARAAEHGIHPGTVAQPEADRGEEETERVLGEERSELADRLLALAGGHRPIGFAGAPVPRLGGHTGAAVERTPDEQAYAIAAAAIDYHRREHKTFWWEHFARLTDDAADWSDTRDVLLVDLGRVERDWLVQGRQARPRRIVRLRGTWAAGSGTPNEAFALYRYPAPFSNPTTAPGSRAYASVRILEHADDGSVLIEETLQGDAPFDQLPIALTPAAPPRPGTQVDAIERWATRIVDAAGAGGAGGAWPDDPVVDLLRRTPPRTYDGAPLEPMRDPDDGVRAVVASLLRLDSSYLAVQGPPGTGKTHLASHVIAELVRRHRWRIGVVAQSHAVVEHVLDRVVRGAGLPAELVGKSLRSGATAEDAADFAFTPIDRGEQAAYARRHRDTGFVVGGTAWDFSNPRRFDRGGLDLLVIDEAGQFSLASTIAASVAARSILLLGDPQQLPQVSQGIHPEPVDASALGWVGQGHDVLPAEIGYFLAESRRMHDAVTEPVSELSYESRLRAHASTASRRLEGVAPGLHAVAVPHQGDATSSEAEADAVVGIVARHLGAPWTDPGAHRDGDPLTQRDVIVVTPYNAQRELIRERLVAAELPDVRVGTVDKFQGQEAVVSIVSLAASSAAEVPRGIGFLLSRNRLNVAISRAQWAAYLVHSPALLDHLPHTADGVAELSRFIRLVDRGAGATLDA